MQWKMKMNIFIPVQRYMKYKFSSLLVFFSQVHLLTPLFVTCRFSIVCTVSKLWSRIAPSLFSQSQENIFILSAIFIHFIFFLFGYKYFVLMYEGNNPHISWYNQCFWCTFSIRSSNIFCHYLFCYEYSDINIIDFQKRYIQF